MQRKSWFTVGVAVAIGVGVVWVLVGTRAAPGAAATGVGASATAASEHASAQSSSLGATERAAEAASATVPARAQLEGKRRGYDRTRADAIRKRAAERTSAPSPLPAASGPRQGAPGGANDESPMTPEEEKRRRDYLGAAVREQYFPVAKSCYEELLAREPRAAGKVVMSFAIVSDGTDGVVDRVELIEGTTMTDPTFLTCMRESMYTTIFEPPPPGAEETTVVYPVELSPDPPDSGAP